MTRLLCIPAILLIALPPSVVPAQSVHRNEFLRWTHDRAHPISITRPPTGTGSEGLTPLRAIVADARVVALGEPLHGFQEPLVLRNQVIEYFVKDLGFTAVALETGLAPSKRLHDYVAGRTEETDAALASSFSYGFGNFSENLELLRWLRSYNAMQPPERQVRLYGIDLSDEGYPHQSLEAVFLYLSRVAPDLSTTVRQDFADFATKYRGESYFKLAAEEKNRLTAKIDDLVALLGRNRITFTAASSRANYEWGLRQAVNAAQSDAQSRLMPEDAFKGLGSPTARPKIIDSINMREVAMADNLAWVLEQEGSRGRVLFFGHNFHIQKHAEFTNADKRAAPLSQLAPLVTPAGLYLHSRFGRELVVIGTYFGAAEGLPEGKQALRTDPDGIEALLGGLDLPAYVIDLRALPEEGPLHDWMQAGQSARGGIFGELTHRLAPAKSFDAIIYMQRATPTAFALTLLGQLPNDR